MMYRMGLLKRGMKARELVERRRLVFYCICIVVRAAIIVTVYHPDWYKEFMEQK